MEARYYGRLVQVAGRVRGAYLDGVRCTLSSRLLALKTMNYFVFSVGRQVRSLVYMCAAKAAQVP